MNAISECVERKIPVVVASTGLTAEQVAKVHEAAKKIPVCYAPNAKATGGQLTAQ